MELNYRFCCDDVEDLFEIELPGVAKIDIHIEVEDRGLEVDGRCAASIMDSDDMNGEKPSLSDSCKYEHNPVMVYALHLRLHQDTDTAKVASKSYNIGVIHIHISS